MTETDQIGRKLPRYLAILVAAVLGLSLFPAAVGAQEAEDPCEGAPVANEYVDRDQARDVHETNIDCVIYRSIAVGSTNAQGQQIYQPLNPVTRGQMASFIAQTLVAAGYDDQLPAGDDGEDEFDDISGNVHRININRLARAEIVSGTGGDSYSPNDLVSRQQMATFIVQAAEFALGRDLESDADFPFTDVSASNVHRDNINKGEDNALFRGTTATTFAPGRDVLRDQMATFLVNLLRAIFNAESAPAVVSIDDTSTTPGGDITGEIRGNAASATVSGCGLTDQAVNDTDSAAEGIQFTIGIPSSQTADCTLTFTITDAAGGTTTRTVNIDVEGAPVSGGVTDRPELIEAEVVEVDTSGTDAGTTIRYTFDELVEEFTDSLFFAYGENPDTERFEADSAELFDDGGDDETSTAVDAFFAAEAELNSQGEADDLRVATVEFDAVQDEDNQENPIGDAALNDAGGDDEALDPGITSAPDVTAVNVGSDITSSTLFEVEVTFDEDVETSGDTAAPGGAAEGFYLVLDNGDVYDCGNADPNPEDDVLDIECDESADDIDEDDIARLVIEAGTVSDSSGNTNPLQAQEVSSDGDSEFPDLEEVEFFPRGTSDDQVAFTFDEPVGCGGTDSDDCSGSAASFGVYDTGGDPIFATDAEVDDDNTRVVIATFGDDDLEDAVGGFVEEGAVNERGGAFEDNRADELGVSNTSSSEGAGFTTGPDLTDVTFEADRNVSTGTLTGVTATFTFDEDLDTLSAAPYGFFLEEEDGTRYTATDCELTDASDEPTVECSEWDDDSGDEADPDDLLEVVLGEVGYDEVQDDDGLGNPEGSEPATEEAA